MRDFSSTYSLPNVPAVYAFYSGAGGSKYVVYVGIGSRLKQRITQHLIRRDSSVATGTSAASLNPDFVTSLRWWEHPKFTDKVYRQAAEMIAFRVLNPTLRSRGGNNEESLALLDDEALAREMESLFSGDPAGQIVFPNLADVTKRLSKLALKIDQLSAEIKQLKNEL